MTTIEIIGNLRNAGVSVSVKGNDLEVRCPKGSPARDIVEQIREHKPAIINVLKALDARALPQRLPVAITRLELARIILAEMVPDRAEQRRIWESSNVEAKHWHFFGGETCRHVLAGNVLDHLEKSTGKLICFIATDDPERFAGWFFDQEPGKPLRT